jgi:glycosyltransferase involved in cell wall biosynthesis
VRRTVVVGIPVRNEEGTIVEVLGYVLRACRALRDDRPEVDVSCVVCFNGCTDSSEALVRSYLDGRPPPVPVLCTESAPGLVPAMTGIVSAVAGAEIVLFAAADIVVAERSLSLLYGKLVADDGLQVAYAAARAMLPPEPTALQRLLCTAYRDPRLFGPRRFFRGACFAVRREVFENGCVTLWADESEAPATVRRGNRRAPVTDDIYMSMRIVSRYGLGAIARVREATFLNTPGISLPDFFLANRRNYFEYLTLRAIWPEDAAVLRSISATPVQWRYVVRQPPLHLLRLLAYLGLRKSLQAAAYLDATLFWHGLPHVPGELYGTRPTTKHLYLRGEEPLVQVESRP